MSSHKGEGITAARTQQHTGFSLIELLAVLSVTSLIALMATSILFSMLQQRSAMDTQLLVANSHLRLAERFCQDVQQAEAFEIMGPRLQLNGTSGSVTYERVAPRTLRRIDEIEERPRHDDFELVEEHTVEFSSQELAGRTLITLRVSPSSVHSEVTTVPQRSAVTAHGLTVVSELARDHRWRQSEVQP